MGYDEKVLKKIKKQLTKTTEFGNIWELLLKQQSKTSTLKTEDWTVCKTLKIQIKSHVWWLWMRNSERIQAIVYEPNNK